MMASEILAAFVCEEALYANAFFDTVFKTAQGTESQCSGIPYET